MAKRLFVYAISQIQKDDKDFRPIRMDIIDILNFYQASHGTKNYKSLIDAPAKLDRTIELPEAITVPNPIEALFTEFETDVIKGFGVTPFVLLQLLQNYDADLIRKQIRITKRKRGASPTTNIAGFFVNAVKNDYNDPEEAKEAKKIAKQREMEAAQRQKQTAEQNHQLKNKYTTEYNLLFDAIGTQEKEIVRLILVANPELIVPAIEQAKINIAQTPEMLLYLKENNYEFSIQTWRKDASLRNQVYEAFRLVKPAAFVTLQPLLQQMNDLQEKLYALEYVKHTLIL